MGARRTQQDYLSLAEEYHVKWLGKELPKTSHTPTEWFCLSCNHVWSSTFQRIRSGKGCPYCAGNVPKTAQDYEYLAKDHQLQWLGSLPANTASHTTWKCLRCGAVWETSYRSVDKHRGCPKCGRVVTSEKLCKKPEDYNRIAEEIGYRWLGSDVKHQMETTDWLCSRYHRFSCSYKNFRKIVMHGALPCRQCYMAHFIQSKRKTKDDFLSLGIEKHLIFLGKVPASTRLKTFWECACGDTFEASFQAVARGSGVCPACALRKRSLVRSHPNDDYRLLAIQKGLQWIAANAPENSHSETTWQCDRCGREFRASFMRVRRNRHCPFCSPTVHKKRADYLELAIQRKVAWAGERLPPNTHVETKWICFKCKSELLKSYEDLQASLGCPWCNFKIINGARASSLQLRLGEMVQNILQREVKVNEKKEGISVDLVVDYKGRELCIFYDSSTWHTIPETKKRDEIQNQLLLKANFWVLRVRSDFSLPSQCELENSLSQLSEESQLIFLTLPDWGVRPGFHERAKG